MSHPSDYFVAGGTLRPHTPSYVTRPADQELYESVLSGEFCYVLTPRQMGKSSLMVRTARRLKAQGVATVIIDLTSIGTGSIDEWYLGLLTRIASGLRLRTDVQEWWESHALSAPQRFMEFLHDVVLAQMDDPVTIMIDEIDSTLKLGFRDDFFAAIRAMYNARASDPVYKRLTFVFLGVATPTDLIQDRERTPFNIGQRIVLEEFDYADARKLEEGLDERHARQGETILTRIFYWTDGHPYLTQKLCLAAATEPTETWSDQEVDALVETAFFGEEGRKDTNLTFVQDRIQTSSESERRRMLKLYGKVHRGKTVTDDDRSPIQNDLELYGLVRAEEGRLRVRNKIYEHVFDQEWIKEAMPSNRQRSVVIASVVVPLLLVALVVFSVLSRPKTPDIQADIYRDMFRKASTGAEQLEALAGLFELGGEYNQEALQHFYGLRPGEQETLLVSDDPASIAGPIETVVQGVYVTLDTMPDGHDRALMEAMINALKEADSQGNEELVEEIERWKKGRELAQGREYSQAVEAYTRAIDLNPDHPVVHYDRAMAHMALKEYEETLVDLDQVVRIAATITSTAAPQSVALASGYASRFLDGEQMRNTALETIHSNPALQDDLQTSLPGYAHLARIVAPEDLGFFYQVRVRDQGTGNPIAGATFRIEVRGNPILDATTDADGLVKTFIDAQHANRQGTLTAEAPGYQLYAIILDLNKGISPGLISLDPVPPPPTPTYTPTRTPTPTDTPTHTPTPTSTTTPTPTPTPLPQAVANQAATVYQWPHVATAELATVLKGETVSLLGRVDEQKYGRWLHIQTDRNVKGFVYAPWFDYTVSRDALPIVEIDPTVIPPPTFTPTPTPTPTPILVVTPGPLQIEHIWPSSVYNPDGGWTAYFEVTIWGGDGRNYQIYWDQEPVEYTAKDPLHRNVAVFQRPGSLGKLVGTVWVESGGQRVSQAISVDPPEKYATPVPTPTLPPGPGLSISAGTLAIEHIWPSGVCRGDARWVVRFEIYISGGDGQNYTICWDGQPVAYSGRGNVATIQLGWIEGNVVGTVSVESGEQRAEQKVFASKSKYCQ